MFFTNFDLHRNLKNQRKIIYAHINIFIYIYRIKNEVHVNELIYTKMFHIPFIRKCTVTLKFSFR